MNAAPRPRAHARFAPLLVASLLALSGCGSTEDAAESALLEGHARSQPQPRSIALEALDGPSREALARAAFPVLLFPSPHVSTVLSQEGEPWVAVSTASDGVHLSLHGTSLEHPVLRDEEVANLPTPTTFVRGVPAWLTLNEQIRSAAWHEGAIAWTLEVECDRPMDDTRCTAEDYVMRLAETLELVDPRTLENGGAR
ncbi:MAG: hypothetical protein K1X94_32865 [Sandaracinaceae bacterium]|nr:hypothetical protein [Sandaracinaceae bacterium]